MLPPRPLHVIGKYKKYLTQSYLIAANCGETRDLLKCSRCQSAWFCSVKCQKVGLASICMIPLILLDTGER